MNSIRWSSTLAALFAGLLISCGGGTAPPGPAGGKEPPKGAEAPPPDPPDAIFTNVTAKSGVSFRHFTGATGEKYIPETIGSGVCAFDYDGDLRTDLYFANGAPLGKAAGADKPTGHLYRNRGDGTFEDVTVASGTGHAGYGIGCAAGDFDNDGHPDLYLVNFGPNVLYRNRGDGTFQDVTAASGTGEDSFSTGATFVDVDRDGDLDLYVVTYMDFHVEDNRYCGEVKPGYRAYCGPMVYPGLADRLFRNDGGGRFTDVSVAAGVANPDGRGLGVVAVDYDDDGDADLYVANDGMVNYLYRNDGHGKFTDVGLPSGTAVGDEGTAQAGMGVDAGDYDGDGRLDLVVANLTYQPSALYRNNGDGTFTERSYATGVAGPTHLMTGYGIGFFDFDNDGNLDLYQANGNMMDNAELYYDNVTWREPAQLFQNKGDGTFAEIAAARAPALTEKVVGRGSAILDLDDDGNLDIVIVAAGEAPRIFRNRGTGGGWVKLLLQGTKSNRSGFGVRVKLVVGGRTRVQESKGASGYASQSESLLHFGLGSAGRADSVEIRWPSGKVERVGPLAAGKIYRVVEGSGKAEAVTPGR